MKLEDLEPFLPVGMDKSKATYRAVVKCFVPYCMPSNFAAESEGISNMAIHPTVRKVRLRMQDNGWMKQTDYVKRSG